MTVVVGVDGSGRTHRLAELAAKDRAGIVRVPPAPAAADLAALLATARAGGQLVVVDDAHRLDSAALRTLVAAAAQGQSMLVSRRPTIDRPELADLDELVAAHGRVEHLGPLDPRDVAALAARVTGRPVPPDAAAAIVEASAGLAAVAAAVAAAPPGQRSAGLVARVNRRLALLAPAVGGLARLLALRLELPDDVLAAAARLDLPRLAAAMRSLRDEGLLVPDGERMIPAVADAVLAELPPAERRRVHEAVADALVGTGAEPVAAAGQLRAARMRTPTAAGVYRSAGEQLRFTDPAAAVGWFDDAADAGADPGTLVAGRAEAAALLGLPVDAADAPPVAADAVRLALVDGAVAAHQGRADRAAESLLAAGRLGQVLAVPALLATGRPDEARRAATAGHPDAGHPDAGNAGGGNAAGGDAPASLRRLAEGALAAVDPADALPLLIEAAEAVERLPPAVVLPDTPHALGALLAVTAGDSASAEHLLRRALAGRVGGPVAADRHRLLLAWVRLRVGRYDTAVAEIRRLAGVSLAGRERVLLAAVTAGIARRSGDIARIRDSWAAAEQVLARRAIDLFQLETLEELLVAAARLRQQQRIGPILAALDGIVDRLGRPPAWAVAAGWIRLQVAVAGEDTAAATTAADRLGEIAAAGDPSAAAAARLGPREDMVAATATTGRLDEVAAASEPRGAGAAVTEGTARLGPRQLAQCAAAARWVAVLAGDVDPVAVLAVADRLAAVELPWEASRLVGQAAIRTTDPAAARRLLERARELSNPEPATAAGSGTAAQARSDPRLAGLSEREVEVARLVLAGRTHRDIGAQLYISPKTVEHHVARIRTKLGATTRAEFVAAVRDVLSDARPGG